MNKTFAVALISFTAGAFIVDAHHRNKHENDAKLIKIQTQKLSAAQVFMEEAEKTMTTDQKRKFTLEYNTRVRFLDLIDKFETPLV